MDRPSPSEKPFESRLNWNESAGSLVPPYNPFPTPNTHSPSEASATALPQPFQSNSPSVSPVPGSIPGSIPGPALGAVGSKVAIPRLVPSDVSHGRRRSARACEPCRQRKIKCDGLRPSCGQCVYHHQQCSYEDVKRVRDQKRLGSLAKRVEAYEALLRDLESEVDLETARKITRTMKVCSEISDSVSPESRIE